MSRELGLEVGGGGDPIQGPRNELMSNRPFSSEPGQNSNVMIFIFKISVVCECGV